MMSSMFRQRRSLSRYCCFRYWQCLVLLHVLVHASSSSSSSSSSYSYNAYHYDVAAPMFTPDGRLLQVEYASRAASHSSPLVLVQVPMSIVQTTNGNQEEDKERTDNSITTKTSTITLVMTTCSSHSSLAQDRLVVLGGRNNNNIDENKDNDAGTVLLCMNGVLADNLALLRKVQDGLEQDLRSFGSTLTTTTTISARRVASIVASACQNHAFGGGIRPYGSRMWICGIANRNGRGSNSSSRDDDSSAEENRHAVLYQTDASGALVKHHTDDENDDDGNSNTKSSVLVVGGSDAQQARIKSEIQKVQLKGTDSTRRMTLKDVLTQVAKILIKNDSMDQNTSSSTAASSRRQRRQWLEVAVLSPTLGIHRLTDAQIESLLESIT